uniref:VWFD domain-containing protein n=1 Tax=Elaeophora elaphi TaxID=1147741 RepID=A0A0R3RKR5_9BILA
MLTATPFRWDFFEVDGYFNTDKPLQQRTIKTKASYLYRKDQANMQGLFEASGKRYAVEGHWRKSLHGAVSRRYIYAGKFETPQGSGIVLKHIAAYNHKDGQRTLKKQLKFNEKEMKVDTVTVYRDGHVKVGISASSTFEVIQYGKVLFDCRKGPIFWNCDAESNVNHRYVIKGHETLSAKNSDIGYLVKLGNVVDNEGKIKFDIDNQVSKYNVNAMLRRAGNLYNLEMDVNNNRGIVKLQTPTHAIDNAQVRITRRGATEFEVEGENRGRIYAHIKTGDYDKLFKIQITEIREPFELHLENSLIGDKQKSIAKLTLDPLGQKRTYGIENEVEGEGETFRALRSTLRQPKRTINIELIRPAKNKYALSIQPNVGGSRRPTVAEMTYQRTADGYQWEGSISDQALKIPLKAKIVYSKQEQDQFNYRLDLQTEFAYSNEPNKLFTNSLHLHRSIIISPKRLTARYDRRQTNNGRFVAELKSTHLASNLNTRFWTKIDRSVVGQAVIPVHAIFGLETRNLQHQTVEYSLETKTDGVKFTEIQMKSPDSSLKARIDKISDGHYIFGFYENNERPSAVGELKLHDNGAIFQYQNEKLNEIKFHASAQKLNDYEGKIDIWHSEASKKIQDARLSLQVKEGNVWKSNIYLRPTMQTEIVEKAKETVAKSGEFHQFSFMLDAFLPIFSSHKQIANDVAKTLDGAIKEWTIEQR